MDDKHPSKAHTNGQGLQIEFNDILAIVQMLNDEGVGIEQNDALMLAKLEKLNHFIKYSENLGVINGL